MLAYRLGFPQPDNEDAVTLEELENFIDKELRSRLVPDDYYRQTFQTKKVFGMNTSMYGYNAHADKPRKSSRKCSECGKSGHTKSSCPKKKKKGKVKRKLIMLRMIVLQNLALLTVLLVMILIATLIYVMV